jgi:transketolase
MHSLHDLALALRVLSLDMVSNAQSGHIGMPLGMADVLTTLYYHFLEFLPEQPDWPLRDRVVWSAGHGSALLYALLHVTGYAAYTVAQLKQFRQLGSCTPGHPEHGYPGIEATTGPLGQGLAMAVGMAISEARWVTTANKPPRRTYALVGDGCLMEGISHEALSLAGHLQLERLVVIWDNNGISIDGPVSLASSDDTLARFRALQWDVITVDGHCYAALYDAFCHIQHATRPTLLACQTCIGKGLSIQGTAKAHGASFLPKESIAFRKKYQWPVQPFTVPEPIVTAWRSCANRVRLTTHPEWQQPAMNLTAASSLLTSWQATDQAKSTRMHSHTLLTALAQHIPYLLGGSADLTLSNGTLTKWHQPFTQHNRSGNYLHYGVREHAMGAIMNGLALSGHLPYGGTFLVFSDYMRPAIRLAAMMKQKVVYVMTHDSIGVGEDGPTHQPIEQLASLRLIPNVRVFRPCDETETAACWAMALNYQGPSVLVLSRQTIQPIAYQEPLSTPAITLLASGSEVMLARQVAQQLPYPTCVISVPEIKPWPKKLHGLVVVIEAALPYGWHEAFGVIHLYITTTTFGKSAPYNVLYKYFGLCPHAILIAIQNAFSKFNIDAK